MFNNRGEAAWIDPPSECKGTESRARTNASGEQIAQADVVNRRPPARRASLLGGFPWRQLAWSALAGALAAVLSALALLWSGWTIG
jgi:hypothetical protein